MSRLPDAFIDDLLARTDLVALIGETHQLKKAGKEYEARCPFHDEKSASFTVSPVKGFYHCFGCGAHGTAIKWLMETRSMSFREAAEMLALRVGLALPAAVPSQRPRVESSAPLLAACSRAADYFREQLTAHVEAQDYLLQRGITADTAARFGIGFAPNVWDGLRKALANVRKEVLADAGLLSVAGTGHAYDKFRGRIMFPIHDRRGRTIGFGGRAVDVDGAPKYLNSPETPIFAKGNVLYGLNHVAVEYPTGAPQLVVVEGFLDVVSLAQAGVTTAVATLGTALTEQHVEALYNATDDVIFCFDGDAAGRRAAWKALETVLPALEDGRSAAFLFLPDGEDPDSIAQAEGGDAFRARIDAALPLSEFLFGELAKPLNLARIEDRAKLSKLAKPLIDRMPAGVYRELMRARLIELAGAAAPPVADESAAALIQRTPIRQAIALLLHSPQLAARLPVSPAFRRVNRPGAALLADLIDFLTLSPEASTADVLAHFQGRDEAESLRRLAAMSLPGDDDQQLAELRAALGRLDKSARRRRIELLKQQDMLTADETNELKDLLRFDRDPARRLPAVAPHASGTRH